ncbi:STAS domain-containing protein [Actinokineospora auranticolor]|uniref:Anti-anti-sigma factor n=1 Tax=Actinokineospora auranticolor TaxID=155976 RepID=A0A2S6GUS4_9PSEU|nr:STAS domain-containing protein [Actinokineospora auranticolor]PPK68995.1 anti-anti-sigma factor [Actinokineospora auranticolor]
MDSRAPLAVTVKGTRSAIVVAAVGRIDMHTEHLWREQIEDACAENTTKRYVVVDLTGVAFLSIGAASLILRAHYHCLHRGRLLRVAAPTGPALSTLQVTGVGGLVAVYRDLEEALEPAGRFQW